MTDARNLPVWDDEPWTPLPSLAGSVRSDVCVVGLGGSGLAAIHEVLDRGGTVVGLDAGRVGGGAAGRNGGFLLAGLADFHHRAIELHGHDRALRLYEFTLDEIGRMRDETPLAVRDTGSLRIAASPEEELDCEVQLEAMRADGLPVEPYHGDEGRGLLFPRDASYHPLRRCRELARRAVVRGARLFEHSPVLELRGDGVSTPAGQVHCAATVIAVDGALPDLLPELRDSVRSTRLQMLATAPLPTMRFARPVYRRWGFDYWQQLEDRRLVLGGFRDRHAHREWNAPAEPDDAVQCDLESFLRGPLAVDVPITHRWAARVSYSSNGLPVLEELREHMFVAGAYSGTGNVLGALCGRAAARLAAGQQPEFAQLLAGAA